MTPENFCYWLQGYFELAEHTELTEEQGQIIKDHLQLVFKKETPTRQVTTPNTTETEEWLRIQDKFREKITPLVDKFPKPYEVTCSATSNGIIATC